MSEQNTIWYKTPEVIVTIITSICVLLGSVLTVLISNQKDIREIIVDTPNLDKINFVEYFGLEENKRFTYEVNYKSIENGKEFDSIYTTQVKVLNINTKDNITLIEFDNDIFFPQLHNDKFYLLFISNQVYSIPKEESKRIVSLFKNKSFDIKDSDYDILPDYNLPFFNNQIFSSTIPHSLRGDKMFINHVQYEGASNYFDGKKMMERHIYRIFNQTLSDESYSEFIPYYGFTKHIYHHKGSRIEHSILLKKIDK